MKKAIVSGLLSFVGVLVLLSGWQGCATGPGTPVGGVIAVGRDCAISAGKEAVGPAILEVESAVAQPSVGSALAALEHVAGIYGVAFVSCVVDRITAESTANLARANGADPISARKVDNGHAWLLQHPVEK